MAWKQQRDEGRGPLAGLQVVELASFVSGPMAGMMLADLGAEVIKVESPDGDPLRRFGRSGRDLSPLFVNTNRGKRSVTLDMKLPEGQQAVRDMLAIADVMICNWRPSVVERLGLLDADLAAANPNLIRAYVSGYGATGPRADAPVYDSVVQAQLGLDHGDGTPPHLADTYVVDKVSAVMACQAILAALVVRERSGVAERVDVALLDAAAYMAFPDVMANRTYVQGAPADARNRQAAAARPIRASDGWLVVVPVTAAQIRRTCAVVGRPELADELFALDHAAQLVECLFDELERATLEAPVAHWVKVFGASDVPAGPCLTIDDHLLDEQVVHNDLYRVDDWLGLGPVRHVRYPARFTSWPQLWGAGAPPGGVGPVTVAHREG